MDQEPSLQPLENVGRMPERSGPVLESLDFDAWMIYCDPDVPSWTNGPLMDMGDYPASQIIPSNVLKDQYRGTLASRSLSTNVGELSPCRSLNSDNVSEAQKVETNRKVLELDCSNEDSLRVLRHLSSTRSSPVEGLRRYPCEYPGCMTRSFTDRGGLLRHQREVHGVQGGSKCPSSHCCPVPTCKRHTRGFPRAWNLQGHMRRMHGQKSESTMYSLLSSQVEDGVLGVSQVNYEEDSVCISEDANPSSILTSLQIRLAQFKRRRTELDGDICALEATLRIYKTSS